MKWYSFVDIAPNFVLSVYTVRFIEELVYVDAPV